MLQYTSSLPRWFRSWRSRGVVVIPLELTILGKAKRCSGSLAWKLPLHSRVRSNVDSLHATVCIHLCWFDTLVNFRLSNGWYWLCMRALIAGSHWNRTCKHVYSNLLMLVSSAMCSCLKCDCSCKRSRQIWWSLGCGWVWVSRSSWAGSDTSELTVSGKCDDVCIRSEYSDSKEKNKARSEPDICPYKRIIVNSNYSAVHCWPFGQVAWKFCLSCWSGLWLTASFWHL